MRFVKGRDQIREHLIPLLKVDQIWDSTWFLCYRERTKSAQVIRLHLYLGVDSVVQLAIVQKVRSIRRPQSEDQIVPEISIAKITEWKMPSNQELLATKDPCL